MSTYALLAEWTCLYPTTGFSICSLQSINKDSLSKIYAKDDRDRNDVDRSKFIMPSHRCISIQHSESYSVRNPIHKSNGSSPNKPEKAYP